MKTPDAKAATPPTKPDIKTADAKTAPATAATATPQPAADATPAASNVQAIDSHLTKDGAILTFKGAGPRGSAVFIRGLTAWIVLQNAPGFDTSAL